METAHSSKTPTRLYQTIRRHMLDDSSLHTRHCANVCSVVPIYFCSSGALPPTNQQRSQLNTFMRLRPASEATSCAPMQEPTNIL
jgi:hypothetical protein